LPELPEILSFPGYDAWMVTGPGEVPVTSISQLIPRRLQVAPDGNETLPVPPVWEKVIVSPEIGPKGSL